VRKSLGFPRTFSSKTDDVRSYSLEASTGHDTPDLGEPPVVSLYNDGGCSSLMSLYP